MFLIIGYAGDATTRHVIRCAKDLGSQFEFLDLTWFNEVDTISYEACDGELSIKIAGRDVELGSYGGIYTRHYYYPLGNPQRNYALSDFLGWLTGSLLDVSKSVPVVNLPNAGASNGSKLFHIRQLQDCGFTIPESWIVGNPQKANTLLASGTMISKPCSATRSESVIVDNSLASRIESVRRTPTQLQQFIKGDDVRLHWLQGDSFALKTTSTGTDYRFDKGEIEFEEIEAPESIQENCRRYCEKSSLTLAGFDFKVTDEGKWFVLESNPMPGFDYYDEYHDNTIAKSLIDLLSGKSDRPFIDESRRPAFRNPTNRTIGLR